MFDEIIARAEAATPGPWINRPEKSFNVQSCDKNIASCFRTENADFIAHAREDIPALLTGVDRLTAELQTVKAERDGAVECISELERYLKVLDGATYYVKPNTGIWHTIGVALQTIQKWRGRSKQDG